MNRDDIIEENELLAKENHDLIRQNKEYRRKIAELESKIADQSDIRHDNELLRAENGDLYDEIKMRQCQIDSIPSMSEIDALRSEIIRLKDELSMRPKQEILEDLKSMINWLNDEYELALDPMDPRCLVDELERRILEERSYRFKNFKKR